ncbi:MAG: hypothetical protein ACK55I_32535, partial [bacterium]
QELIDDAKADGALQMVKNSIAQEIMSLTGMMPGPDGQAGQPIMSPENGVPMGGQPNTATPYLDEASQMTMNAEANLRNRLVTEAYGTQLPQRRVPEEYEK